MKIVSCAIYRDGLIISMPRVGHSAIVQHPEYPAGKADDDIEIQGFLLDDGNFLDRISAMTLAISNGQLKCGSEERFGEELFWEDLR